MNALNEWVRIPSIKQILIVVMLAIVFVPASCGGGGDEDRDVDTSYKPPANTGLAGQYGVKVAPKGSKKGNKYFDPSAESSSTAGKLATTLSANCELNIDEKKVSCEAHRTFMESTLNWSENLTGNELSGKEEGIFEFTINHPPDSEVLVALEECIATTCTIVETTVDVSETVP